MKALVVILTLIALALGAGGGYAGGFVAAVIGRVHTDTQIACALLQTAENAGHITREQRGRLVDTVVPPLSKDPEPHSTAEWIKVFADAWWDSIREDQKSDCPGV